MITCHDSMTPLASAQRNMHVDHIVMAGGRTDESNTSGNVEIHHSNLDIERLDQTCQTDLPRAAPSLCYDTCWDTQPPSATPQVVQEGLH